MIRSSIPIVLLAALALATCKDEETSSSSSSTAPLVVVAPLSGGDDAEGVALDDALAVLTDTLETMGHAPRVERITSGAWDRLERELQPGLAIVLDADRLGLVTTAITGPIPDALGRFDDRFTIDVSRDGDGANPLDGEPGRVVVALSSRSRLARFYAVYELLRRLGARYYHPEEEWIPTVPDAELTRRAAMPTVLGPGPLFTPDFTHRSFSFHGAHPLEHMEAFSDGRHPIDEALRVNDWIIKNRGDQGRGAGRGIAPEADRQLRREELAAFHRRRGFRSGAGITLHAQQQGATPDIDRTSDEPIEDQIRRVVTESLAGRDEAYRFGIHFGPTELTTTPDLETVDWINLAGRTALELRPDIQIEINDHTSGNQPVEHFDDLGCPPGTNDRGVCDYYDLAFHTDPRFGVKVHTVMFPPLEGPAGVYQQVSFAHKLCLMQKASAEGRPLVWFPESAYWLSWDNAVPVYLPLYLYTRHRDIELLRPLLRKNGGTLRDHRLFNSGHEWGYWQADYGVGLLHWNTDIALDDILGELADPLCDAAQYRDCPARTTYVEVLRSTMELQAEAFLRDPDFRGNPGGLYTYFAGEDPADVIGASSGLEFRPVPLPFREVLSLSAANLERFREVDLAGLERLEAEFSSASERLTALRPVIPSAASPWLEEVIDGLDINTLRARHTRALFEVAVLLRDHPAGDPDVTAALSDARAALDGARVVIAKREAAYRYPLDQVNGGGVTPETAVPNGTTYPFRLHTKTHLLTYWESRQAQADDLVAGEIDDPSGISLTPVFGPPGEPVLFSWPDLVPLSGAIEMGDGRSVTPSDAQYAYAAPGIYRVEGLLETSGAPLPVAGVIVRTDDDATMAQGDFTLTSPDSDLARTVLASLVPPLRIAVDLGETPAMALAAEPAGPDSARFDEVVAEPATVADQTVTMSPFDFVLPIPDPATGIVATRVGLSELELIVVRAEDGSLGPATLSGLLSVQDLVDALVALAGFEPTGASNTLAGILGFDPTDPPETVPFSAEMPLAP